MASFDLDTGKMIDGLDELFQSIEVICVTPKGTRVLRRNFGADLPDYVDRGIGPLSVIDWQAGIAEALAFEPRFRLIRCTLSADSAVTGGQALFDISGLFYPRGHLGDLSEVVTAKRTIRVAEDAIR
jgi:phage baseplate assembly protein W